MTFLYALLELCEFSNTLVGTATNHMTDPIKYLRKPMKIMQEDHQCAIREETPRLHWWGAMDELGSPSQ